MRCQRRSLNILEKFWEPRLRNIICEHPEQGGAGRDPAVPPGNRADRWK